MNDILTLLTQGKLPSVDVNVQLDDKSIYKLILAIVVAMVIVTLFQAVVFKNSK